MMKEMLLLGQRLDWSDLPASFQPQIEAKEREAGEKKKTVQKLPVYRGLYPASSPA